MSSEGVKRTGSNLWRSMPYSPYTMAAAGVAVVGGIWYFTVYSKKKPEASGRVSTGVPDPQDTRPRK